MPLPNWDQLEKNQTDPEKIEEAITRLIQNHLDDPDAHLLASQSLYSHKAAEIIDHLAQSIVLDKLANFSVDLAKLRSERIYYLTAFESIDGWTTLGGSGGVTNYIFNTIVRTGAIINTYREFYIEFLPCDLVVDFSQDPLFQTSVLCEQITNQIIYITFGESQYFGFKIMNGTLYAYHWGLTDPVATEITGINLLEINVFRAEVLSAENKILFYVNEVLKATHTTNLPTCFEMTAFCYYIKTLVAAEKYLVIGDLLISIKR